RTGLHRSDTGLMLPERIRTGADPLDLENSAELSMTSFCWWRADLTKELAETYWRDVHGIMFARAPGLWRYRQLRLGRNRPELWPSIPDIRFYASSAAQPDGIPHALILNTADLERFGANPLPMHDIPDDAKNFIERIGALLSPPFTGRTLVDRLNGPTVQGPPPVSTFAVCFVSHADDVVDDFHHYLTERIAAQWSRHPDVMRLRVEPLPPYRQSVMPSPGVPHQWPTRDTYLGWIEIAVRHDGFADLIDTIQTVELARYVKAIHTYPVRE